MPKGVEHQLIRVSIPRRGRVEGPMMPKGVEHIDRAAEQPNQSDVEGPMMPKGVEHSHFRIGHSVVGQWKDQ